MQCSDSAAFGYYTVRCGATSVVKMVLGSEFLTVLQRLQEPATSAWRWGFYLQDWNKLLFLGGLHSPCDNYSFLANVYCLRTKERRVLTGQLLLSAVKSCWNQLCLNARLCRRLYSQLYFLYSNIARYLVDPASSHMLVSKIKPCMSKYKPE